MTSPLMTPDRCVCVMHIDCLEQQAHAISDLLLNVLDAERMGIAAFESQATTEHWKPTGWTLEVYFQDEPEQDFIRNLIAGTFGVELASSARFDVIAQEDWVQRSLAGLGAVRAGRFLVHGSHHRDQVRGGDIGIEIEAALAFGTGHHGTTRGCLLLLDALLKRRRPRHVVDIGTGTGVLAIAAARVLHQPIACGDIDAHSVAAARANAVHNFASAYVRPLIAQGLHHTGLRGQPPYDLIMANILAGPLQKLALRLAQAASSDCELILSGLLKRDVAGVLSAYRIQGFVLTRRLDLEGWVSLNLARSGVRFTFDEDR